MTTQARELVQGLNARPLAGRYPAAVALGLLALSPFIVLSTASALLTGNLTTDLHASRFGVELASAMSNAGYAFGAVAAADLIQRLPARRLYLSCEVGFVLASALAATSPDIEAFTLGRTAQGLCTGMLLVAALPPLVTQFGPEKLPWTAAYINLGLFGMVTLGPLAGGVAAHTGGWRWLYAIVAAFAAIGAFIGVVGFQGGEQTNDEMGFDWSAIPFAATATFLPFFAVSWVIRGGFGSAGFIAPLIIGLAGIATLLFRQYHKREALMPLKIIAHTVPVTGIGIAMVAGGAVTALVELSATWLQTAHHESPLVVGALLTTQIGGMVVATWLFKAMFTSRWLPALAFVGLASVIGGGLLLLLLPTSATVTVAIAGALLGFGAGAGVSPALFIVGLSAPSSELGPTFALVELLRSEAAFLIAPVLLELALHHPQLTPGIREGFLIVLVLCAAMGAVLLGLLLLGGVRPHAPDLDKWIEGKDPAYATAPIGAALRQRGG